MVEQEVYKVYAIKHATKDRKRSDHFFGSIFANDPLADYSMPMDFYIFAAVSENYTVIIDTGVTSEVAKKRNLNYLCSPVEALKLLKIDAATVPLIVYTHLHWDHTGNLESFPNAKLVVQESEMSFWTGRYASRGLFRNFIEENDIVQLVQENLRGRVCLINGIEEIVSGITGYLVGGHSEGQQVIKINTAKGSCILASDAAHFYENINEDKPFTIINDLVKTYRAFDIIKLLSDESNLIIPGHDPKIMEIFPPAKEGLEGIAVRLA